MLVRTLIVGLGVVSVVGCGVTLQQRVEQSLHIGTYTPPTTDTDACRAGVKHLITKAGVPVHLNTTQIPMTINGEEALVDMPGFGMTDHAQIWIKAGLASCAELETLAHEIGHVRGPVLTPREGQVFADAVSYAVVKAIGGYDPTPTYVEYLSGAKMDARVMTLYKREIQKIVDDLVR